MEFRVALRLVFVALHFFLGTENRWAIQEDIKRRYFILAAEMRF